MILADVEGVRANLSEQGAKRVGKDYEAEPVAVSRRDLSSAIARAKTEREGRRSKTQHKPRRFGRP